jgi:hypothetical protein
LTGEQQQSTGSERNRCELERRENESTVKTPPARSIHASAAVVNRNCAHN